MQLPKNIQPGGKTMSADAPRIVIAMGDPAGISTELLARLLSQKDVLAQAAVTVIGDRRVLALGEKAAGVTLDIETVAPGEKTLPQPGKPIFVDLKHLDPATIPMKEATAEGGKFAMRNFGEALLAAKAHRHDGIMFTPFNKLAFKRAGNPYPDEIRWASDLLGWNGACSEYNKLDDLWNARVTSHEPLRDVADLLTHDRIVSAIEATDATLRRAGVEKPRIAVAGLNPHAGEGGTFGREEIDVIAPAVETAAKKGFAVDGPWPADTVWIRARRGDYDVVLTMYHDQGQIALKLLGFERGVTILGGMPVPICTPAHGTAYDIQGKGIADPSATIQAFRTLVMLAGRESAKAVA
jgi:4-hydroxythreonine-4-phosphate dehydrogenase